MKKYVSIAIMMAVIFSTTSLAANKTKALKASQQAVESLMMGLESENYGLKLSSAYMLGELSSKKAVFSLMRMLRTANNEDERIVAALALYKIGDPAGLNIVKKAISFDESGRVRKHCSDFYHQYVLNLKGKEAKSS